MLEKPIHNLSVHSELDDATLFERALDAYKIGDLVKARHYLDQLDENIPRILALKISVKAGFNEWEDLREPLEGLLALNEDNSWALDNVFDEISGLLDRRFYDHAYKAIQALPETYEFEPEQKFTAARVYYEVGDREKAKDLIEKLDSENPLQIALLAGLQIGLHQWEALQSTLINRFALSPQTEWVFDRLAGEINRLLDDDHVPEGLTAVQSFPERYKPTPKLTYAFARAYYESAVLSYYEQEFLEQANNFLAGLDLADRHVFTLQLAVYAGLNRWREFSDLYESSDYSWQDIRWVYNKLLDQISIMTDRSEFDEAFKAYKIIPSDYPIPARYLYKIVRIYFELDRLTEAEALIDQLGSIDGAHRALKMAISAGLYQWPELQDSLETDFEETESMNWVIGSIFTEIDDLIDRNFPKEALSAISLLPRGLKIPEINRYSHARAYYENGLYEKAYEIGKDLDLNVNKNVGLMIGITLGHRDWAALSEIFNEYYYPNLETDWMMERLPREINAMLDMGDVADALEAAKIVEENLYPSDTLSYTLARCYYETAVVSHYEPSFLNRAYIYSDPLDQSKFENLALHLGVLAGMADWVRFRELNEEHHHSWRKLKWVYFKVLDQVTFLADKSEFEMAYLALRCVPFKFPVPRRFQFDIARTYFAVDKLSEAEDILNGLDEIDPRHEALQMAIYAKLGDWTSFARLSKAAGSTADNEWVWDLVYPEFGQRVQEGDFVAAWQIQQGFPEDLILPEAYQFAAARTAYEMRKLEKADSYMTGLVKTEPKIIALDMAIKVKQGNWVRLSELMALYFDFSADMNWVIKGIFTEIKELISEGSFSNAKQALQCLPVDTFIPVENRFGIARVYYENGDYLKARNLLSELEGQSPAKTALQMAITAELHEWDSLETALEENFDPSGEMDWVLERVYAAISKSEFGYNQNQAARLENLLIERHFNQASVEIKERLLAALTRAGRYDIVLRLAGEMRSIRPLDTNLLIIMTRAAYLRRKWDLDKELFEEFLVTITPQFELYNEIAEAVRVVDYVESNSPLSSQDAEGRVTDRLLDIYFRNPERKKYRSKRKSSVALVGENMAAGGAEHVLINAHIGMLDRENIANQMWLHNIDSAKNNDHFLKQYRLDTGDTHNIHILPEQSDMTEPFKWFEGYIGRNAQSIYHRLLKEKPTVLHAWQDSNNIECALAGIMAGVPKIVLHPHNMRPDLVHRTAITKSLKNAYRALLTRKEVHLVCCSRASLNDYLGWLEIDESDNCHVVYNGFAWPNQSMAGQRQFSRRFLRNKLGIDPNLKVVAGIFRMAEVKQPMLWAETARRVIKSRKDTAFVIFGDGSHMPDLEKFIAEHKLEDRFFLAGRVENAAKHSAACDVLLQTSRTEGLPTVLIEAMSNGIPVIASDVGGTHETFAGDNEEMFQLVDGFNPARFERAICNMLDQEFSPQDRKRLSQMTKAKFGVEAMVDGLIKVYGFK